MLGEYSEMKREAYGKKMTGSTAYAVIFLPLWFVFDLIGFVSTLSADPIPTSDAILGLISVLMPIVAFATLFLADVTTMVANLIYIFYHAGWSVYSIVTCLTSKNDTGIGFLNGFLAVADTFTILINAALLIVYVLCAILFILHRRFFTLRLAKRQ